MNNKKCPYCGFINFVDASECRKCETVLTELPDESAFVDRPTYRGGVNSNRQAYQPNGGSKLKGVLIGIVGLAFGASVYAFAIRPHVLALFTANCEWTEYRHVGTDFTVTMPSKPSEIDPTKAPPEARNMLEHFIMSEVRGQGSASFGYVDYTTTAVDISKAEELLNRAVNGSLEGSKSKLISKTSSTFYGMPSVEFECEPPPGTFPKPARAYGKYFVNSTRVYMLLITGVEGSELLAGKDKFLNPRLGSLASK
jgi:hypothetical protein